MLNEYAKSICLIACGVLFGFQASPAYATVDYTAVPVQVYADPIGNFGVTFGPMANLPAVVRAQCPTANGNFSVRNPPGPMASIFLWAHAAREPVIVTINGCDPQNNTWFRIVAVYKVNN